MRSICICRIQQGALLWAADHLLTRSWSFCRGSGSPSLPHVRISLPSYTLMIRSAVLMRKQLQQTKGGNTGESASEQRMVHSILITGVDVTQQTGTVL